MIQAFIELSQGSQVAINLLGLVDQNNVIISSATVLATMFDNTGAVVPTLQNVTLTYTGSGGNYQYIVPATFVVPTKLGYTVTITVTVGTTLMATITTDVIVSTPIDLTTINRVKGYLGMATNLTADDGLIQDAITSLSYEFMQRTGRGSTTGDLVTQSPYVQAVPYTEYYDGNGNQRIFLRNYPVRTVTQVAVNGLVVPQSTDLYHQVPGWVIDGTQKAISLVGMAKPLFNSTSSRGFFSQTGGNNYTWPGCFTRGVQNILVQYTAGYSSTPQDIDFAVRKWVALNYKRKGWIDQRSQAMAAGAGTITYRDWEISPDIEAVIFHYTRLAAN